MFPLCWLKKKTERHTGDFATTWWRDELIALYPSFHVWRLAVVPPADEPIQPDSSLHGPTYPVSSHVPVPMPAA